MGRRTPHSSKLDVARQQDDKLDALWRGEFPPGTEDTTGSAFAMRLATRLKPRGDFSPTEFGQLLYCSEHRSDPDKMDARYIARAWGKAPVPKPDAEMEFSDTPDGASPGGGVANDWHPEPHDLWEAETPPTSIPEGVLPSTIWRFAVDRARRIGVSPAAVAVPAIAAYGSLVSSGNRLQMHQYSDKWTVSPTLWALVVGPPGSAKSPALSAAMEGSNYVDAKWRQEYAKAKEAYDAAHPPEEVGKRRKRKAAPDEPVTPPEVGRPAENADVLFDGAIPVSKKPVLRQKILNDTTTEAVVDVCADNPAGVIVYSDELAGWIGSMDTYRTRAGKDRGFWLSSKDGKPYTVNRKGTGVTTAARVAASIVGTIQDDKLAGMATGLSEDGLLQRFAMVAVDGGGCGEDFADDAELDAQMKEVALRLADCGDDTTFKLSPRADAELKRMQAFQAEQKGRIDLPGALKNWLDKSDSEFGRYCLVFHLIEWASAGGQAVPPPLIPHEIAYRARRYVQEVLFPHARYVYETVMHKRGGEKHAQWIGGHLLAHGHTEITARNISRAYAALRGAERRRALLSVMLDLEALDWVKAVPSNATTTRWRVNPAVHERFAARALVERDQRERTMEAIAQTGATRKAEREASA